MLNEVQEVESQTVEVNSQIDVLKEEHRQELIKQADALIIRKEEANVKLSAAKAVLADRKSVLRELKDSTYWPNGYTKSTAPTIEEEEESATVSEDEEETIIDTPEESTIEKAENNNGIYKIDSTTSSILPDTLGEVPVIVEANSIYMIADYEFKVPAEGKFFNLRTINKMIKRLKVLSLEARIKVLEDLSIYFDEKGVERIREGGVLIKDSTGEIKAGDLTTEEEEDKVSKETGIYKLDSTPTESTTKVDGAYPISSTSDEGWFLDDWEKE